VKRVQKWKPISKIFRSYSDFSLVILKDGIFDFRKFISSQVIYNVH